MLKSFRLMLFPFALIYWAIIRLRNLLFDWNVLKSASFNFPIICIGNLAMGGTGKTPMTELLIAELTSTYKIAVLSRGYKRKTKGFAIANASTTAIEIGDEPMQFHKKFPKVTVAVGEERLVAIPQILFQQPATNLIILDDAFQHRSVRPGLNILLTEYGNLFTRDFMFPMGDLRDTVTEKKRANIIIVTKCPPSMSEHEKNEIRKELQPTDEQTLYFTCIAYGDPYKIGGNSRDKITLDPTQTDALLVCGIANPATLKTKLTQSVHYYEMLKYPDHHIFSSTDLQEITHQFNKMPSSNKILLTTEKDAVRLEKFGDKLQELPIYAWPITHRFLFEENALFLNQIHRFISEFEQPD